MKTSKMIKGLLLGLSLLLAASAFAANKGSLSLSDTATVGGKQLPAGDYSVQWDGSGSQVQVNILKGKKIMASAPARMVDMERPAQADSAVVKQDGGGSRVLSEIRFSGKKYSLSFGDEAAGGSGSSSSVR